MQRFNQRQGFLVSAMVHLTILMILISRPPSARTPEAFDPSTLEKREVVLLSPEEIRRLMPQPRRAPAPTPPPAPTPVPAPTPPSQGKDRISVGPPSDVRQKGPIILRREDDLTKAPKGEMNPTPASPATPPPATPAPAQVAQQAQGAAEQPGREGLRLPPGLLGRQPSGEEGARPLTGPLAPSIAGAVEDLSRRATRESRAGIPTGTGQQMGGLYFDPQGADFTLWISRFSREVYANWIVPDVARFGAARGHVDFEFTVERDGTVSALRVLKSSGTPSLDKAAQFALTSSRLLPLPDDYGPPRLTINVTFYYGEAPQGS